MLTLKEQLKDSIFRKWFALKPPEHPTHAFTPPWFVYVQAELDGSWRRGSVETYSQGYKYIASHIHDYYDLALSHKRQEFKPPIVTVKSVDALTVHKKYHLPIPPGFDEADHVWCPYCRRMTKFSYFTKHHALKLTNGRDRRCEICGVRLVFIKRYH